MKVVYRVIDTRTNEDITDKHDWILQPNGRLAYNAYGDLIGLTYAEAVFTIDGVEQKRGKWIPASTKPGANAGMKCSECKARISYSEHFNGQHRYCHKCGAKMTREAI